MQQAVSVVESRLPDGIASKCLAKVTRLHLGQLWACKRAVLRYQGVTRPGVNGGITTQVFVTVPTSRNSLAN